MVQFLQKFCKSTKPSSRIIADDVAMGVIVVELVKQWWLLWKR
jgi:hypothetical protein